MTSTTCDFDNLLSVRALDHQGARSLEVSPGMTLADLQFLKQQAAKLRRLAREIVDEQAHRSLIEMVEEYEARARLMEGSASEETGK